MTREDAIYWIRNLAVLSTEKDMPQIEEALNMAIEALTFQQGEWVNEIGRPISDNHLVYCSICGERSEYRSDFCPNCGAEMADRKTESDSEKPNNCETCKHNKLEWFSEVCDGCSKANSNYEPKTEPQSDDKHAVCTGCDYYDLTAASMFRI